MRLYTLEKMTVRLDHLQLAMPEGHEQEARRYFSGILGMTEETKPSPLDERGGCWFRSGGTIIHLGVETGFKPQRKAHPAFLVTDLDRLAARLAENGYPVRWDHALPDRKRLYSTDPFGNRIELMADGDGFSQKK